MRRGSSSNSEPGAGDGMSALQSVPKAWRVAAAAAGLQFLHGALLYQAFGAYLAMLVEERGWSKAALAGGAALQSLEGAILGPALGWIMDRVGTKVMVQAGVILFGAGFVGLGLSRTIGEYYVAAILIAIGASCSGHFPLSVTVMHWFHRKRARALSVMNLGIAVGGACLPLVAWSIHVVGWRSTAILTGIGSIAIALPLAGMLKHKPSAVDELVDGEPVPMQATSLRPAPVSVGTRDALRSRAFWCISLGHACALLVVTAINVHAVVHMKEGLGYTITQASLVIMMMTISQVVGIAVSAGVGDRVSKRLVAALCMLMHMAGLLALTFATNAYWLAVFAILHGGAWGIRGALVQAMRADYFGLQAIGTIMGLSALVVSFGQIGGPLLAGAFADATGNYRTGSTLIALTAGAASTLFLFLGAPPSKR
jgi:MFS family permease